MLRRTLCCAKRPATVNTEVGSNRYLAEPWLTKSKEMFAPHPQPPRKVIHNFRYFIKPGKATTGPPLGPDFTKISVKAMDFSKAFNDRTKPVFKDDVDLTLRVQMYEDNSFQWRIDAPPSTWFILRAIRKKRRETSRDKWVAYITLEMLYEIAKQKQFSWDNLEHPPIETRVRRLAGQCRMMGVCVIGVDTPDSPVHGMTEAEYQKQSEEYRKQQWEQWVKLMDEQLQNAPLYHRLHRIDFEKLSPEQVTESLRDPKMMDAMWRATRPQHPLNRDMKDQEKALMYLRTRHLRDDLSFEETVALFEEKSQYRQVQRMRERSWAKEGHTPTVHWSM
eukprot:PhM_4_TR7561/c0_g1_i1/m.18242/K02867/RP-L11, MRPL11, rplK; large subunit ribosomal protein L11